MHAHINIVFSHHVLQTFLINLLKSMGNYSAM